jgi:hypothetical protein
MKAKKDLSIYGKRRTLIINFLNSAQEKAWEDR